MFLSDLLTFYQKARKQAELSYKLALAPPRGMRCTNGRAQLADEFFNVLGAHLPYRVNVADFILDLASGDVASGDRWARCACPGGAPLAVLVLHARLPVLEILEKDVLGTALGCMSCSRAWDIM